MLLETIPRNISASKILRYTVYNAKVFTAIRLIQIKLSLAVFVSSFSQRVIELNKKYLPQLSIGFSNPKVKVHIQDGNKFLNNHKEQFDVIITDSSDPIGPAKCLFERPYYEKIEGALKADGIMCAQG